MGALTTAQHQHITLLLKDMNILPLTEAVAKEAARIYQTLRKQNQMIDHRDIFIAATAKVHGLKLKTINKKHFVRVPDLEVV